MKSMGGGVGLAYAQALKREPVSKLLSGKLLELRVLNIILKLALTTLLSLGFQARLIITF